MEFEEVLQTGSLDVETLIVKFVSDEPVAITPSIWTIGLARWV